MQPVVTIWLLHTDQPGELVDALAGLLDASERARAEAITDREVHAEFVVSHAATRQILGRLLAVPPGTLRWRYGPSGKPSLASPATDLQVSLSHSEGLAALAISAARPVGIDVQRQRSADGLVRMAGRYYPAAEAEYVAQASTPDELGRRFSSLWTRKEACAKVSGGRLIPTLAWASRRLSGQTADDPVVFLSGDPAGDEPVVVMDLPMPDGFHGAVALAGTTTFRVVTHWWTPESLLPRVQSPTAATYFPAAQIGVPMAVPGC
jgi:4'-phosphopantetheinyl transferase